VTPLARLLRGAQAEQTDSLLRRNERIRHDLAVAQRQRRDSFAIDDGEHYGPNGQSRIIQLREATHVVIVLRLCNPERDDLLIAPVRRHPDARALVLGGASQIGDSFCCDSGAKCGVHGGDRFLSTSAVSR
jgi:hypothetical protein